jgi:hypothetical protein
MASALPFPVSVNTNKRLCIALTDQNAGNEAYNALNAAVAGQSEAFATLFIIAATGTSTTTGFGALAVGDVAVDLTTPAKNTNVAAMTVITAGTLPYTPTSGDVIMAMRPVPTVTPSTFQF